MKRLWVIWLERGLGTGMEYLYMVFKKLKRIEKYWKNEKMATSRTRGQNE